MQKIKIRLPAVLTDIGPGQRSLGLALSLYTTVEISGRDDTELMAHFHGEGADQFEQPLRHPVVRAMSRLFQHLERTQPGINVRVDSGIPSGLGAEAAFAVAGVMGANSLLGSPCQRDDVLKIAASTTRPDAVTAALLGGLTVGLLSDDGLLIQRSLPVTPFELIVVHPTLDDYNAPPLPEQISRRDALHNTQRLPLLLEALRTADLDTLAQVLDDRLQTPHLIDHIPGYGYVSEIARARGAIAVAPCGAGPALMAIARERHRAIGEEMVLAFKAAGVEARFWVLPVDTQGIVISMSGSA
jgi:homoserine kinase